MSGQKEQQMQRKPWLIEKQVSGKWTEVDRFLTSEQAIQVANILSWQRNEWHRARYEVDRVK